MNEYKKENRISCHFSQFTSNDILKGITIKKAGKNKKNYILTKSTCKHKTTKTTRGITWVGN